ncbi:MAG: hypothetical protein EOO23_05840 [Comamonadaceae bacterium]|nr:MAG: hypothetical protein EOO23_05840 [Comamonadaceae bacterium]
MEITSAVARGATGEIRVGYSTSMLYRGLPKILDAYRAACPGVSLVLHESHATQLVNSLRHKNIDAAFVNTAFVPDGLSGHIFSREEFSCVVPKGHRLEDAHVINMLDLRGEDFVMFRREASPPNYDNVMSVCRAGGIEPRVRYGASQWMNMVALVGHGYGVSIVPRSMASCGVANAVFVPLEEGLGWCVSSFLWNQDHVGPAVKPLLDITKTLSPFDPVHAGG